MISGSDEKVKEKDEFENELEEIFLNDSFDSFKSEHFISETYMFVPKIGFDSKDKVLLLRKKVFSLLTLRFLHLQHRIS